MRRSARESPEELRALTARQRQKLPAVARATPEVDDYADAIFRDLFRGGLPLPCQQDRPALEGQSSGARKAGRTPELMPEGRSW